MKVIEKDEKRQGCNLRFEHTNLAARVRLKPSMLQGLLGGDSLTRILGVHVAPRQVKVRMEHDGTMLFLRNITGRDAIPFMPATLSEEPSDQNEELLQKCQRLC